MASQRRMSSSSRVVMEKKMDDILVKILDCPFIEKQQVDVIVNSISPTLHLSGRKLSSAIKATAGPGLERALQALPEKPKVGDVLVTPGYGLKCKYIYHVVVTGYYTRDSEKMIEKSILQCLTMANNNCMNSIAIPALGTGGLGLQPEVVAKRMLRALSKFKSSSNNLREVRFALIGTDMRVAFIKELSKDGQELDMESLPSLGDETATIPQMPLLDIEEKMPASHQNFMSEDGLTYHSTRFRAGADLDQEDKMTGDMMPLKELNQIRAEFSRRRSYCLQEPFIPWRWTGMMHQWPNHLESEWLDALQEDLFMIRPRSPIVLHGAAGIGRTRFLEQIQELWYQGSLPKFKCVLHLSGFGILHTDSLWRLISNHLVEQIGLSKLQAANIVAKHSSGMLVLVDDADIISSQSLTQTLEDERLSKINFVFATRTPEAIRLVKCLNPSDIVELKCFIPIEVERYVTKALEGKRSDIEDIVTLLTSEEAMYFSQLPSYLGRICNLLKRQQSVADIKEHMRSLHDFNSYCLKHEPYMTNQRSRHQSWYEYLEECSIGAQFYDYITSSNRSVSPFSLNPLKDRSGTIVRHAVDFAVAKHIAYMTKEEKPLTGCTSLSQCFSLQAAFELACGMSQQAANTVQKHILYLAEKDQLVQKARENILDLQDEESATAFNLLTDLESRCRREARTHSNTNKMEGVPMELQNLGPEYVLAYQRACAEGSQPVYRTRVMLVGHFGAGKTSVKRRLVNEPFNADYSRTNGIEADPSACKIFIDNTRNWRLLDRENNTEGDDEYSKEIAKLLHNVMQRLKPIHVGMKREKKPKLDSVVSLLNEFADEMDGTYSPLFERTQAAIRRKEFGSIKQKKIEVAKSHEETEHVDQNQLDAQNRLVLAELPPEVLQELRSLIEKKERSAHQQQTNETEVKLSFWDFAGQAVFYTTHQTFLTHRAIYIVVLDLTKPLETPIQTFRQGRHGKTLDRTCPQTVGDYLDYWLNCIHTHAMSNDFKSPSSATTSPPIIIVGTHRDVIEREYPDTSTERIESYYATVHKYIERKAYFDHVHLQFFSLANNVEDDPELHNLKQKIISLAMEEPYWGETIPLKWTALRDKLRKLRQQGVSVSDQNQVLKLATEVGITDREDMCTVLRFYHELGDVVFFNEPHLRDFIVLDPQWLIDAFRKVITISHFHIQDQFPDGRRYWRILEEHGVLHDSVLDHVWEPQLKEQLINLMYKFRLLLPLPYKQLVDICGEMKELHDQPEVSYLVPCLLPPLDDIPEVHHLPPVLIIFREEFLPVGVMSRLITALVTESQWTLSGKVFYNYAIFLPGGIEGGLSISLCQKEGLLEVQGRFLNDDMVPSAALFRGYIMELLRLLQGVVGTVCPMARFTLAVWCRCHNDRHSKSVVEIGLDGEQLEGKERIYCRHHWKTFSTSAFCHWFRVAFPAKLQETQADYPSDRTLLQLSEGIGNEWQQVAIYLGLTSPQLQQARIANPYNIVMCMHELLVRWRSSSELGNNERVTELQKAFKSAGRTDIAEMLDECYEQ